MPHRSVINCIFKLSNKSANDSLINYKFGLNNLFRFLFKLACNFFLYGIIKLNGRNNFSSQNSFFLVSQIYKLFENIKQNIFPSLFNNKLKKTFRLFRDFVLVNLSEYVFLCS